MSTDEKALMLNVQRGELDKLAILFENNHVQLFNYFLRTGNSRAVAEDLVQETFMRVLAYRTSFNGSASFKSWLYGIARNTTADYYRKLKVSSQQMVDIDDHDVVDETTLTEVMESCQQQALFEQSLKQLSTEERDLIVLSRFQQLNYQDIADMLQCNLNTLKSRMGKAVSNLRQAYKKLSGEVS